MFKALARGVSIAVLGALLVVIGVIVGMMLDSGDEAVPAQQTLAAIANQPIGGLPIQIATATPPPAGTPPAGTPPPAPTAPSPAASQDVSIVVDIEQAFAQIYQRVSPSVVAISIEGSRVNPQTGQQSPVRGSGSGFVIDHEGHIITNYHVVEGATRIAINFFDGTITRARIVGLDPGSDLAVLQVDLPAERLHPVEFGDTDELVVGQIVLAIGSPFGQRWTMTSGVVSALNRTIRGLTQFSIGSAVQTDAAINPGNSGGPLLNLRGQVIGVTSQILSDSGANSGVGFAIPSNLVVRVAEALIRDGSVDYTYIGITGGEVNLSIIEELNLANDMRGVVVDDVLAGGPAERGGLLAARFNPDGTLLSADIITAIDGVPVTSFNTLVTYLATHTRPGDQVTLTVFRDGAEITLRLTLQARPTN